MRVLIVKVSSLGDIIHTLPAVTDAYRAKRGLRFDWVVEEAFTEIPGWHPAVDRVIPVSFRRWRKNLIHSWRSGEFGRFKKALQTEHYDLVIDAQGLIKSGVISRISRGLTVGLSNHTIREPLATLFYNVMYTVPWQQHAVERVRDLFSRTFNYSLDYKSCDYGLDPGRFMSDQVEEKNTLVFFHGTTWETKKWPQQYWQQLASIAADNGLQVKIPWRSKEEFQRAQAIAKGLDNVEIIGDLTLTDIAKMLVKARAVVAVDTGLAHLAAALGLPVVSLYGPSDPELTGTYGHSQLHLKSNYSCSPCLNKICHFNGEKPEAVFARQAYRVDPPCFADIPPEVVWERVMGLMQGEPGSLDSLFYT